MIAWNIFFSMFVPKKPKDNADSISSPQGENTAIRKIGVALRQDIGETERSFAMAEKTAPPKSPFGGNGRDRKDIPRTCGRDEKPTSRLRGRK